MDPSQSPKFRPTVRKDIVVCCRGRGEVARRSVGVQLLPSGLLSAAVDPGSPPRCGRRALHRLSSQTAGQHGGVEATEAKDRTIWLCYCIIFLLIFGLKG